MRIAAVVLSSVLGLSALTGCGSGDQDSSAANSPGKTGKAKVADPKTAHMVAAVSSSKVPGAVDLRFELAGRPVVGEPVDVRFAIIPQQDLETLYVKFSPGDGLEVTRGAETERLQHPAVGVVIEHVVGVVPKTDGVFYLTAIVDSDSESRSLTRNYSVPIIAGAGLSEPPPAADTRPESAPKSP
jgi:hypothetical protein